MSRAPRSLSPNQAARVVAALASDPHQVSYTVHARQRMRERGIEPANVIRCLRRGVVTEGPTMNIRGNWQVRMTRTTDGRDLHVVVALEWQSRLIVVTAITD